MRPPAPSIPLAAWELVPRLWGMILPAALPSAHSASSNWWHSLAPTARIRVFSRYLQQPCAPQKELLPFAYYRNWLAESSEGHLIIFPSFSTRNISTFQQNYHSWQTFCFSSSYFHLEDLFLLSVSSFKILLSVHLGFFPSVQKWDGASYHLLCLHVLPVCCVRQCFQPLGDLQYCHPFTQFPSASFCCWNISC